MRWGRIEGQVKDDAKILNLKLIYRNRKVKISTRKTRVRMGEKEQMYPLKPLFSVWLSILASSHIYDL